MTFVGKILVVLIFFFAVVFLGVSTFVFSTAKDWKTANDKQVAQYKALQATNSNLVAQVDVAKKDLEKAKSDHAKAVADAEKKVASLEAEIKASEAQLTDSRGKMETTLQSAKDSLAEAKERLEETLRLREQKAAVEKQANEYKVQQTDLNDKIRELERQNKTLDDNTKVLRDRVARFSTLLRRNGLSDDVTTVTGLMSPPDVEGKVTKVDGQNKKVEISIGSDDGLVPGHELHLYRTKPRAEYLGKIKILSTDPDQAVGQVIGTTIQGKKIKEGDDVSSTIRPRS